MAESRKHKRKSIEWPCWIGPGPLRPSLIRDVSISGARIVIPPSLDRLPERIQLFFNDRMTVGRICRVVWQSNDEAGVEFLTKCGNPKHFVIA